MEALLVHSESERLTREGLAAIPAPESTATFQPIPHLVLVNSLLETLSFRRISVVKDEYAVSKDGMKLFGVMDLETQIEGCRFSLGIRNANDKSMRLALTVGYRVFVCDNMAFHGDFTPVLAKHSKHFNLLDALAIWALTGCSGTSSRCAYRLKSGRGCSSPKPDLKLVIYQTCPRLPPESAPT